MNRDTDQSASTPLHSVSVAGAVIREDGRMLAIRRRDNSTWEPPGGVLELDETPEDGVVREVLEETGVHVEVEHLTGVYKNMARGIVALVFRCKPTGDEASPSPEATAVEWLTKREVTKRMRKVHAIRLLDSLHTNFPRVRAHDGQAFLKEGLN